MRKCIAVHDLDKKNPLFFFAEANRQFFKLISFGKLNIYLKSSSISTSNN